MTESMWAYCFLYVRLFSQFLYQMEDHDAGKVLLAVLANENIVFVAGLDADFVAFKKIQFQFVDGFVRYGHKSLFGTFSHDPYELFVKEKVGQAQVAQFADTQSAAV